MFRTVVFGVACAALFVCAQAQAADRPSVPPDNAMKLSRIIGAVEQRDHFHYVDEIEWDDGYYDITYYTTDKAKVELKIDPVSGKPATIR